MRIYEICIGPKGPVFGREITTVSIYLDLGNDTYADVSTSIEPLTSVRSGYVNAWLYFALTLYEPKVDDSTKTHCSTVLLSDPGGYVPALIGNAVLANRTKFYSLLKKRVESEI